MAGTESEITISFEVGDRRTLIATLCEALNDSLVQRPSREREGSMLPWHATAGTFEALPGRVIELVLDGLDEAGSDLQEIEFSGYLETDQGPRAWGFLAVHDHGRPEQGSVVVEDVQVVAQEAGYRCEAHLRRGGGETGAADA